MHIKFIASNVEAPARANSAITAVPPLPEAGEPVELPADVIEKHEEKFTVKTALRVVATLVGLGVLNAGLNLSGLTALVTGSSLITITAALFTGGVSFYLGNHVKHILSETKAEASYVRKERMYETAKGAVYALSFLYWPRLFLACVDAALPSYLNAWLIHQAVYALAFHIFLGMALTPTYALLDSAGAKLLNLHNKRHEPYLRSVVENAYGAYKFFYCLRPWEGETVRAKVRDLIFGRGLVYSILAFVLTPQTLLPTIVCGINTFFAYYHSAHKEKGMRLAAQQAYCQDNGYEGARK